jgi:ubiquitin C-terminal hydrolase
MKNFISAETDLKLLGPTEYELQGLTVHHGSMSGGHYIAYVKRQSDWYLFNDDEFSTQSESKALSQQAYLLFYT